MTVFTDRLQHTFFDRFREWGDMHFSPVMPSRLDEPVIVSSNRLLAEQLGIDPAELEQPEMLELMSGNFPATNIKPIALVYSGHQFGVWAGQLGDGRAMTLGELPVGNDATLWDIQLKGAGPPPTPDLPMAAPSSGQVFANISVPTPCTASV